MQRKTLLLTSFFFLSLFFIAFFLSSQPSEGASTPPADFCSGSKTEVKSCVGIGYTWDQAGADGNSKCTTACITSQNVWCSIRCTAANDCICTKGDTKVRCTLVDKSCLVYDAAGDIDPKKTTGSPCVVECKTPCDALCSGKPKRRGSREEMTSSYLPSYPS